LGASTLPADFPARAGSEGTYLNPTPALTTVPVDWTSVDSGMSLTGALVHTHHFLFSCISCHIVADCGVLRDAFHPKTIHKFAPWGNITNRLSKHALLILIPWTQNHDMIYSGRRFDTF
jgi:hypothetical protein